ncbi:MULTISPECIES: alcohol dehydrogenase AdhP [Acinetobacter]|jgi:propanol-preferring alcohol dehydrogenase|uniref:alcohol dehydrogenase n=1 Tax=Acinetobacter johnsonii SH046 TaxID=575586 RepID=D0SH09_ACIJO|nr:MULTISPECIES: alcohol dehydrogenase AdhP [Acinetobacter]ALD02150.1 alcohol dehydrogenase [Acinetobacter sp. TTH0-4]EEY94730.1 alcohol dehydrogenase [Acinetobacter johnsonii SH046]MBE9401990.1 alcohol dehydrogenase AdhP [Acinetobacter albensis]MDH2048237.1 alcohol dehydrogenase AdhP [Acinetobacter johnsonii]QPF37801.1 alcohol dehydrogenase AdhP [Acinetobacter sp. TTH0-4]
MPKMMKAAVVTAFNKPLEIKEMPIPEVTAGKVLVKIIATGICHTDLHAMQGDWPIKPTLPFIPGHEGVGEVVEIGAGIDHLKVGDVVGIPWLYSACGHCDHCYAGWETLCKLQQNSGYSVNGSFAEYCLADGEYVGVIPEGVDLLAIAPILCAGVTVYKGLKMTEAKTGNWVAISGIGGLGHVAVQYAKTMGFNVVAIDVDDSKLELAKSLGADVGINALKVDVKEAVLAATGEGCHGVLVTAVSPKAFEQAVAIVRRGGTMVLNGLPPGKFDLSIFDMVLDGITVRGSIVGTRLDLKEALDIAAKGKVKAHISVEPIENINDIFSRMEHGKIDGRIVVDMRL